MSTNGRDKRGRFTGGNPGGPGRPRRPVEQEYLATLNSVVSLDAWRQIVDRAVADAKSGDSKAREWLAKYIIGDQPTSLTQLAADEQAGLTVDIEIGAIAAKQRQYVEIRQFQQSLSELLRSECRPGRRTSEADSAFRPLIAHSAG